MADSALPYAFPELPQFLEGEFRWSANVETTHSLLVEAYDRATQLLCQENGDALRLRIHSENIFSRSIPLLEAMEPEVNDFNWVSECAHVLAKVMVQLESAAFAAEGT